MSRADGQAPWTAVPHTVYERWVLTAEKPFPEEDAALDFEHLTRCAIHRGHEMPSARALAARWGWSADKADRLARRLRKPGDPLPLRSRAEVVRRSCGGDAEVVRQSEPENVGPIVPECGGDAEVVRRSCGGDAEHVAGNEPVQALLLAPKNQEENNQEEHTSKPAKAGGGAEEVCADLLKAMHAIALEHDPKARLQRVTTHETRIARTLKGVAKEAKAAGKSPAELILDGWRWWWANPRAYLREQYPGAAAYPIVLQAEKVLKYAAAWAEVEAARYIPTADEALDAVIEVGSKAAGARYPAVAHVISEVFVQIMGARLEKMRENPQQERMRAVWRTAYDSRVTRPALSLVAR